MGSDRTSFRAKVFPGQLANRNFTPVFGERTSFRAKGLRRELGNRNFTSIFADRTSFRVSCERIAPGTRKIAILPQFLPIEPHFVFRAKGLRPDPSFCRSNIISCEKVAFRAVSLALPRAFKREIEKKERARGQERM